MLFAKTAFLTICFVPISVLGSSLPSPSISGEPLPDGWHQINLSEPEVLDTNPTARDFQVALDKRNPINVCQAIIVASACLNILDHVIDYTGGLTGVIKGLSDQHSCGHMTGTFDNIKWSFYATDQHCDTTAQRDTIRGAIAKYIQNAENGKICGVQCLRLNYGGTWD